NLVRGFASARHRGGDELEVPVRLARGRVLVDRPGDPNVPRVATGRGADLAVPDFVAVPALEVDLVPGRDAGRGHRPVARLVRGAVQLLEIKVVQLGRHWNCSSRQWVTGRVVTAT